MKPLIAAIECASSPANPGGYSTPLLRKGWQYALDEYEKAKRVGATGLMLHLFDSRLIAGEKDREMSLYAPLVWQHDPRSAGPINSRAEFIVEFCKAHPKDQLTIYVGKPTGWLCDLTNEAAWLMAKDAMAPYLWAEGVNIVFDEAGRVVEDTVADHVIQKTTEIVAKRGGSVMVEGNTQPWSTTAGMGQVLLEGSWRAYHAKNTSVHRWLNGHEAKVADSPWVQNNTPDVAGFVADCHRRGDTPIVNVGWIGHLLEAA